MLRLKYSFSLVWLLAVTFVGVPCNALAADLKVEVLDEGTYRVGKVMKEYEAPESLDGKRKVAESHELLSSEREIYAELGVSFGYRYKVTGIGSSQDTIIEMRALHPPLRDSHGKERKVSKASFRARPREGMIESQIIVRHSDPQEDISGEWVLQIWVDGDLLASRAFQLMKPLK